MIIDGATNWGKGGPRPSAEGFDCEARSKSIYEWVRQVRGGVLAGAFTVERHISGAIIYFMLGDRVAMPEVQAAFDEGLLGPLSFERRINAVMLVAQNVLSPELAANLKADLNELKALRNVMAHKPFWFEPELNETREVVQLVPMIQRGKSVLPLTSAFVEQVNKLVTTLIERTSALASECARRSKLDTLGEPLGAQNQHF